MKKFGSISRLVLVMDHSGNPGQSPEGNKTSDGNKASSIKAKAKIKANMLKAKATNLKVKA